MKTLPVSHLRRAHTTICFSALLLSAFTGQAVAQTTPIESTWIGNSGNNFSTDSNWSTGQAPGDTSNTDIAIFTGSTQTAVIYQASRTLGGIQFSGANVGAYSITSTTSTSNSRFRLSFTQGGTTSMDAAVNNAQILDRVGLVGTSGGEYTIRNNAANKDATLTILDQFLNNTTKITSTPLTTLVLDGSNTGNNTIAREITSSSGAGTLAITKQGTGTWVLGGASMIATGSTFTGGVTVNQGRLVVNHTNALGKGTLTVTGGTLDLFDTGTGQATLGTGANFSMTGGTWSVTLGTTFDNILGAGAGTFSLADSTLALDLTSIAGFSFNNTYQILSGFSSGTVSNLAFTGFDSALFTANLSNTGLLSFSAIPEPSTFAVISGLGVLGICLLRRRRPVL